jgi:uncharacterized protein
MMTAVAPRQQAAFVKVSRAGVRRAGLGCAARSNGQPPQWLVIMVKSPVAGRVKTRLARAVGTTAATAFYRGTARAVIARLARDKRWRTIVAVAPDADVYKPFWPAGLRRIGQGSGDLGARMQRLIEDIPAGRVVVIGTDIPAVRPAHIANAFRQLGDNDAVFGPAEDGGFWLVGQRRVPKVRDAFEGVRWSSADTLSDTLANLAGCRVARAATLSDVDEKVEMDAVSGASGRIVLPRI